MRTCGECRFCCWSYAVDELHKPPNTHCSYECKRGCSVYYQIELRPTACAGLPCPYLDGEPIHRPDTFQRLLEEMGITMSAFFPAVPEDIDKGHAEMLILTTRSIPAMIHGQQTGDPSLKKAWIKTVLPLDGDAHGEWKADETTREPWAHLL